METVVIVLALACFVLGRASLAVELAKASQGGWLHRKSQLLVRDQYYIVPEAEYRTIRLLPEAQLRVFDSQSLVACQPQAAPGEPTLVIHPDSNVIPFKKE